MKGIVPFYHNKECYKMYIEARKSDIKMCKHLIKEAKTRIKDKEWYYDGHTQEDLLKERAYEIKEELKYIN